MDWIDRMPVPHHEQAEPISIEKKEPLKTECQYFINCIQNRKTPLTDGKEGLRVLKVLEACQKSLTDKGSIKTLSQKNKEPCFIHQSSYINEDVKIGESTKIRHCCHILKNTQIGKNCSLGQNVMAGPNVKIGNNVKIQNNV
ncbi:UDP-3-O-(3-hydroxymyristoyl)glucosamine N-acyltransferase [subsurface metagenome]